MVGSKKPSSARNKNRPSLSRSGEDKVSVTPKYDQGLVGSRIRVWWPIDSKYYEGVVNSYASSKKKHQVLYDDGDVENLNLTKEKWELVEADDAEANEGKSADEISEAPPEPLDMKKAESNGKASVKERKEDAMPKRKQKIDSSEKSKSKARSGMISEDSEEEMETQKSGVKKLENMKDVEKISTKPETENKMGDIGGKIVAAASRISGRIRRKENGQEQEIAVSLKSGKKVSESNNRKQKRLASSSEADSVKGKKPRTSSEKMKSNSTDEKDGENEDADDADEEPSDDDSKLLVSLLKKSPEALEALMEKLKRKKEKEAGEGTSRNETEVEEKSSQ